MNLNCYLLIAWVSCAQIYAKGAHINVLPPKKEKSASNKNFGRGKKSSLLKTLMKSNLEIKRLLSQKTEMPVIWEGDKKILTGKTFEGVLLNSIYSTNLKSPVLVSVLGDQSLPMGTKFSCFGATKHSRVQVYCNKMILKNKEIRVTTQILNTDGSSGLIGEFDDGKEDLMIGIVASSIAEGVFAAAQDRVGGGLGSFTDNNLKNQTLGGLIEGSKGASDVLLDEYKTQEPVVAVNSGTKVLIYFMEALNDY
jgi:hypothetical protein